MAEVKLEETRIPEDVSKDLAAEQIGLGAMHVGKIVKTLMTGASKLLGNVKELTTPKAVAFRKPDGTFIAGAKVEYHKNPDDPSPAAGNWSYVWTFYEKDLDGCQIIDLNTNMNAWNFFESAGRKLFNMDFAGAAIGIRTINTILDHLSHWLEDNAKDGEKQQVVCPGAMIASCGVENGTVVKSIIPDGELKILIKGDDDYQDPVE